MASVDELAADIEGGGDRIYCHVPVLICSANRLARAGVWEAQREASTAKAINDFLRDMLMLATPARSLGRQPTVREAVDLAIAGASKVIEKNLDTEADRKLVSDYLASLRGTAS